MKQKLAISIFLLINLCQAQALERRIALVIGNGSYQHIAPLKNAAKDASDISAKLSSLGFEVIKGINLNKKQMHEKIKAFDKKIRQGNAQDTVALFYYAGHGLEVEGTNYVVPINADMEYQDDVQYEGIVLDKITSRMQRTNAKLNLIVLDACRNNPLLKRNRSSVNSGWGSINNSIEGTYIAFGTAPGRQAADGDGENGLFTKYILKYIDQPGFTLDQVFNNIRRDVYQDSDKKQLPWSNNATIGDFYCLNTLVKTMHF